MDLYCEYTQRHTGKVGLKPWHGTIEWGIRICFYDILNHTVFFIRHQKSSIWGVFSIFKKKCFSLNKSIIRNSRPELFCKKGVLKNVAKFTGTPVLESFLLEKKLRHRCFPVNCAKFLRISIFIKHLRWLILYNITLLNFPTPMLTL